MNYGYARCSTNETKQDINRQVRELKAAGAEKIYLEYEHGDSKVKSQQEASKNPNFIPLSAALRENARKKSEKQKAAKQKEEKKTNYRIFSFQSINDLNKAATMVASIYHDNNSLYKSPSDKLYYLIVNNESGDLENYQRVCNLLSEYGTKVKTNYATPYYFAEHFKLIIKKDALQTLASI